MKHFTIEVRGWVNEGFSLELKPETATWWSQKDDMELIRYFDSYPSDLAVPDIHKLDQCLINGPRDQVFGIKWDESTWFEAKDLSGTTMEEFGIDALENKFLKLDSREFIALDNDLVKMDTCRGILGAKIPYAGKFNKNHLRFGSVNFSDGWTICNTVRYGNQDNVQTWEWYISKQVRTQVWIEA
jgi:hypothetical protein